MDRKLGMRHLDQGQERVQIREQENKEQPSVLGLEYDIGEFEIRDLEFVNARSLFDLLKKGRDVHIVNHFQKFLDAGIPPAEVATVFMDPHRVTLLVLNLEKFPVGSVNIDDLLRLVGRGDSDCIADNLEKFPPGSVDIPKLIRSLIQAGYLRTLANNFHKFPADSVDFRTLIQRLMVISDSNYELNITIIADNLEKFPKGSIDIHDLVLRCFREESFNVIHRNFQKFLDAGLPPAKLVRILLDIGRSGYKILVEHFDELPSDAIDVFWLIRKLARLEFPHVVSSKEIEKYLNAGFPSAELAGLLMDANQFRAVIENFEKFPPDSIDIQKLVQVVVNTGHAELIARNFKKFPPDSIDVDALVQKLMDTVQSSVIIRNLDLFPKDSINLPWLFREMIAEGNVSSLVMNLEKFLPYSVDVSSLVQEIYARNQPSIIAEYFEKFPPGSVDATELVQVLKSNDQFTSIFRNLGKFPPGSVDAIELVQSLVLRNDYSSIFEHFKKILGVSKDIYTFTKTLIENDLFGLFDTHFSAFLEAGLPASEFALILMENNEARILIRHLDELPVGSVDIYKVTEKLSSLDLKDILREKFGMFLNVGMPAAELARMLVNDGQTALIASNLDLFQDLEEDTIYFVRSSIRISSANLVLHYLRQRRYGGLQILRDRFGIQPELSSEMVQKQLHDLVEQHDWFQANELLVFIRSDAALSSTVVLEERVEQMIAKRAKEEQSKRQQKLERPVDRDHHKVASEASVFYLTQAIDGLLKQFFHASRVVGRSMSDLPARHLAEVRDAQTWVEQTSQSLFFWIRQYMVIAVNHELNHEEEIKDRFGSVRISSTERFLRIGTPEEIRQFLYQAMDRFEQRGWEYGYGGSSWARIARVAEECWRDEPNVSVLLDRIFDLQHNSGLIFDKQPETIDQTNLREVLNAKFSASDSQALLDALRPYLDEAMQSSFIKRLEAIEQVAEHPTWRAGD